MKNLYFCSVLLFCYLLFVSIDAVSQSSCAYFNGGGYQYSLTNPFPAAASGASLANTTQAYGSKTSVNATGILNSGGYKYYVSCGTISAASWCCANPRIFITSTSASTNSGWFYIFKSGNTSFPNSSSGSITFGELIFSLRVVSGQTVSGEIGQYLTTGTKLYFVYIPDSNPYSNSSRLVNITNRTYTYIDCCINPTLTPTVLNDGCGTQIDLKATMTSSSGICTGNWEYAWQNTSSGYYWNGSSFSSSTASYSTSYQNISSTQASGTQTYISCVRCSAETTCAKDASASVTVQPAVAPILGELSDQNVCSGENLSLTAVETAGANGLTYTWSGLYAGSGQSVSFYPETAGTVTVQAENNCGDIDTETLNISILQASTPTTLNENICASALPYTYNSDFSSIDVSTPGTLDVPFSYTNAAGCDSVVTLSLNISEPGSTSNTVETTVSETPFDYDVNFQDIDVSTEGTNTYTVTLLNSAGCDSIVNLTVVVKPGTLPVEWGYFTASSDEGNAFLEWQTLSEINCSHFDIEKSYNGSEFIKVNSINASGTINIPVYYNYVDEIDNEGLFYYRIKQVDFDGNYEYSEIRIVENDMFSGIQVNTCFNQNLVLRAFSNVSSAQISIYDVEGRKIKSMENVNLSSGETLNIESTTMAEGVYVLKISGLGLEKNIKIVKTSLHN